MGDDRDPDWPGIRRIIVWCILAYAVVALAIWAGWFR